MQAILNLLSLLLPLAFLPGLMSAGTTPRWAVLALLVPLMLYWVDWKRVPLKSVLLGTLAFSAASLLWMDVPLDGYLELWRMAILFAAFAIGAVCGPLEKPLTLMATGVAITLPLVALQQFAGYQGIPQTASPAGLFLNKNVLAESAAVLLVAMVWLRNWKVALPLLLVVLLAKERAAFVGIVVALIVYILPRNRKVAGLIVAAALIALFSMVGSPSVADRFDIWRDSAQGFSFLGNGIGSFFTAFPATATNMDVLAIRPEQAHNEIIHFIFELGVGAAGLLAIGFFAMRGTLELERLMLVALLAISLFAFPFHMPLTAFVAALVAGRLCAAQSWNGRAAIAGGTCHA